MHVFRLCLPKGRWLGSHSAGSQLQQVRQMATALLARLPPHAVMGPMLQLVHEAADDPARYAMEPTSGLALYYLCCTAVLHRSAACAIRLLPSSGVSKVSE